MKRPKPQSRILKQIDTLISEFKIKKISLSEEQFKKIAKELYQPSTTNMIFYRGAQIRLIHDRHGDIPLVD